MPVSFQHANASAIELSIRKYPGWLPAGHARILPAHEGPKTTAAALPLRTIVGG